jgi:hypothetical protein
VSLDIYYLVCRCNSFEVVKKGRGGISGVYILHHIPTGMPPFILGLAQIHRAAGTGTGRWSTLLHGTSEWQDARIGWLW